MGNSGGSTGYIDLHLTSPRCRVQRYPLALGEVGEWVRTELFFSERGQATSRSVLVHGSSLLNKLLKFTKYSLKEKKNIPLEV